MSIAVVAPQSSYASSSSSVVFDPKLAHLTLDIAETSGITTLVVDVPQTITTLDVQSTWPPPGDYGDPDDSSIAEGAEYETESRGCLFRDTLTPYHPSFVCVVTLTLLIDLKRRVRRGL